MVEKKGPAPVYMMPDRFDAKTIDDVFDKVNDFYKPGNQKKLQKTLNHYWGTLYKLTESHFGQFGKDENGAILVTTHDDLKGKDEATGTEDKLGFTEDLLHKYAFRGLEIELGAENVKKIKAAYEKMRKTGKVDEEMRGHFNHVRKHIEAHFGKIGGQELEYEDIVKFYSQQDLMDAFRSKDHPLHEVFNNYAEHLNPQVHKHTVNLERLMRVQRRPEEYQRVASKLDKLVGKYNLRTKKNIPVQLIIKELQQLHNKNYQPTAGQVFEEKKEETAVKKAA